MDYANPDTRFSEAERIGYIKQHNPQMSDSDISTYLQAMISRRDQKQGLLARGMSNRMAEKFLERQGWLRPFGWHSVFFYPDSSRVRTKYLMIAVVALGFLFWISNTNV